MDAPTQEGLERIARPRRYQPCARRSERYGCASRGHAPILFFDSFLFRLNQIRELFLKTLDPWDRFMLHIRISGVMLDVILVIIFRGPEFIESFYFHRDGFIIFSLFI